MTQTPDVARHLHALATITGWLAIVVCMTMMLVALWNLVLPFWGWLHGPDLDSIANITIGMFIGAVAGTKLARM